MTSREIEIRDKLTRLDPAEFQNLTQELFTQYYGCDSPTHLGSATHTATTAPGTPDTVWLLPDGKFAFLQCGHYPEKSEAKKKIEEDVEKCLGVEKRDLKPGQLVKIVIAYSCHRLDNADLNYLRGIDKRVELFGPDAISKLLARQYPNLAREHLGIEISTGQIMSPGEFEDAVERNSFASTLKVDLVGRDEEKSDLLAALEDNQFVLVYGCPGYGKTRLCLEVLRLYAGENGLRPFVIQSNRMPILDDLNNDIPRNKSSIILLDDANELSDLAGFASVISKRNDIKVLMTVRNYAVGYVKESIDKFCKPRLCRVGPLEEEPILSVIENGFGIAKGKASMRIACLSKGNLRLACAAADVAKKHGTEMFSAMPSLIEACYGEKISRLSNAAKKAALIVSILGPHKLEGNEDLKTLLGKVGISYNSYVDALEALSKDELVDVCQSMKAVAPGEQVLRDYLLYRALIVEKSLSLLDINTLKCGESKCLEAVSIITGSFQTNEVISSLKAQLDDIWTIADKSKRWKMAGDYHSLLGEKGLEHILEAIEQSEPGNHDYLSYEFGQNSRSNPITSRLLLALRPFLHGSEFSDPEELYFFALKKNILSPEEARAILVTSMCFSENSYSDAFLYEREVTNHLMNTFRETREIRYGILLVCYAEVVLSPTYEGQAVVNGRKAYFAYGRHIYTKEMIALRGYAIACLAELREYPELSNRCDLVIANLRGATSDDSAEQLWKATLEEVYLGYVSDIETIDDSVLSGFARLERELVVRNIIDADGLSFLGSSVETRIAALIFADSSFRSEVSEKLQSTIKSASPTELVSAISLVCSASVRSCQMIPHLILGDIIESSIDVLSGSAEEIIALGVLQSAVPNELLTRWIELRGVEQIRSLVLKHHTTETSEWLGRIDVARFEKLGISSELAEDIEAGARAYGETVPYGIAMEIDAETPGFFARYASGVLQSAERGSRAFRKLLPNDINDSVQRAFVSKPEMLSLAEEIMLNLIDGRDAYWDTDFLGFVINADYTFPMKAVPILMRFKAAYAMKHLGEAIWGKGSGEAFTDDVWEAILECETDMPEWERPRALKCILDYAIECCSVEATSWLASRSVQDGKLVDYLPDVAMELSPNLRAEYIALLCRESHLDSEELRKIPIFTSYLGSSWTESEIPLLREKIDVLDEAMKNLSGISFLKHRRVLEEMSVSVRKYLESVEVREFISEF